jgi:hypothetical protein
MAETRNAHKNLVRNPLARREEKCKILLRQILGREIVNIRGKDIAIRYIIKMFFFKSARIVIWLRVECAPFKQRVTGPFCLQVIPKVCPLKMFIGTVIIH